MQEFVHHTISTLEELYKKFNQVQQLLSDRSYEFDQASQDFLQDLLNYFEEKGNQTKEAEVRQAINLLNTVKKGFDPIKMEKISTGKRSIYYGFAFHALENIQMLLNAQYNESKSKLDEGEELLSNLILQLHQNKILTDLAIKKLDSIAKIEIFWQQLLQQNGTISGINKKLRMSLLEEDIFLLFEKVISKIK